MRNYHYIFSTVLLTAALAYTLWFVFAGFGNHQDPLYWLYKYEHLEGGWMAVGTLLAGGVVVRIFGAQLLPLRLVGWLCTVTAIGLPYCCLLDKEQRRNNLHWLALAYVLMGYGAFQEFSPGTLSVLLLSAIWVTAIKLPITNRQSPILTAILAGIAVSVRFPNILALLVLIPLWKKRSLWYIPVAALTAGIIYLLGYLFVTPAPMDPAMNNHDLWSMLTKLWETGGRLLGYMLLAIGVLAVPFRDKRFSGWLTGLAVALFIIYTMKPLQWYNTDMTYLISALCLVIAGYAITNHQSPITNHQLPIGILLLMIAAMGTDTGWLKLFPAILCLLPVALAYTEPLKQRYLYEVLVTVCAVVVMRMTTNSVGQSDLTKADTFCSVAPYQGIAIREAEQKRLLQYIADYDSLKSPITNHQSPILSLGQEMHLMRAVTGCEAAKYNEFWSNIYDSVYTAKYRDIIQAEHPVVFCSFSPQFKTKPAYKDRESCLENMLREEGYREIDRSKYRYMIYLPK